MYRRASRHLGPAGIAYFQVMPPIVVPRGMHETLQQRWALRTRADNAHLSLQHMKELWQFVEAKLPEDASDPCASRVVAHGLAVVALGPRYHRHGAEFIHTEELWPVCFSVVARFIPREKERYLERS